MAKVKPNGHIWGLNLNWYICFLFRRNRTILAKIMQIPYLTLKIKGQGHNKNQPEFN